MLRMVGFGDNIGSGFRKIMQAWKNIGFPHPEIHEEGDVNEVWLTLPIAPLPESHVSKEDSNRTNNDYVNVTDDHVNVTDDHVNVTDDHVNTYTSALLRDITRGQLDILKTISKK